MSLDSAPHAIHPTAIVSPSAQIGSGVTVGPYSIIGPHVKIGDDTTIGSHVVIDGHTTLGRENQIFPFASIGAAPQDLKFKGEPSTLLIGDKNVIREYVTLQPGTAAGKMSTIVGGGNLFMCQSHVAHDCRVGDRNVLANGVALAGHVQIGNGAVLGGMAGIHQFCRIGDLAIVSAGAMVPSDVPPYCMVQGDRATLRGINRIGLQRAGFSAEQIQDVRRIYRHFFATRGHLREKLADLDSELRAAEHTGRFIEFLEGSTRRGIIQPLKQLSAGSDAVDGESE